MPAPGWVFDTWPVMEFISGQPRSAAVEQLLIEGVRRSIPMLITTVNLGEVWYNVAKKHPTQVADEMVERVRGMGLQVVDADWELTRLAAGFKAKYRLSYADCFAAALAQQHGVPVITGDPEFKQLERDVKVRWL